MNLLEELNELIERKKYLLSVMALEGNMPSLVAEIELLSRIREELTS